MRPLTLKCQMCKREFPVAGKGCLPRFCPACRKIHHAQCNLENYRRRAELAKMSRAEQRKLMMEQLKRDPSAFTCKVCGSSYKVNMSGYCSNCVTQGLHWLHEVTGFTRNRRREYGSGVEVE